MMIVIIIFTPAGHLTCRKRITIQRGRILPNTEFQLIPFPALASASLYVGRDSLYVTQHFHSPPFSWFSFLNGTVPPMMCNKRPLNFGHQSMSIHLCHNVQNLWLFLHLISNCFMDTLSTYYTIFFILFLWRKMQVRNSWGLLCTLEQIVIHLCQTMPQIIIFFSPALSQFI